MLQKSRKRPRRLRSAAAPLIALVVIAVAGIGTAVSLVVGPAVSKSAEARNPEIQVVAESDILLVPIPTRAVARGEKLSQVDFTQVKWPKDRLVGDYVLDLATIKSAVARTSIPKLLPIPVSAISSEPLDANAVVEGIPEGMRAITVRVDAESAVEGWARSGNYVDVIVIRAAADSGLGLEAKVIAEKVRILSAERSATPIDASATAPKAPTTVTLLVSQEDALKVKTAANIGKLTFALRGAADQSPTTAVAMNQKQLLSGSTTIQPVRDQFKGSARGPDGKLYVLGDNSRWIRAADIPTALPEAKPVTEETRAMLNSPTSKSKKK